MSEARYRRSLRAAVRGFASRVFDFDDFFGEMDRVVRDGIPRAWRQGAATCGIGPDEFTPKEIARVEMLVVQERGFIFGLADFIADNREPDGRFPNKLRDRLYRRLDLWVNRYHGVVQEAKISACGDQKMIWGVHSKVPCTSAKKLGGQVRRASAWKRFDVRPQSMKLECMQSAGGVPVCSCTLTPTEAPSSRGPLPRLP